MTIYRAVIKFEADDKTPAGWLQALKAAGFQVEILELGRAHADQAVICPVCISSVALRNDGRMWDHLGNRLGRQLCAGSRLTLDEARKPQTRINDARSAETS